MSISWFLQVSLCCLVVQLRGWSLIPVSLGLCYEQFLHLFLHSDPEAPYFTLLFGSWYAIAEVSWLRAVFLQKNAIPLWWVAVQTGSTFLRWRKHLSLLPIGHRARPAFTQVQRRGSWVPSVAFLLTIEKKFPCRLLQVSEICHKNSSWDKKLVKNVYLITKGKHFISGQI
jgi:hypothetical protein